MFHLTWDSPNERYYVHGVDRGVLYPKDKDAVAWNGLTGIVEAGNGETSIYYIDGVVYLADVDATDYKGSLTAYFFPDAFAECIGMPEVTDGLIVDNQKPKQFGLSYRSLIGSGLGDDRFGYQIHLIYNAMAVIGSRSRKSVADAPEPEEFSFDLEATPVKLPGMRPSAHYIIDTRNLDPDTISEIESILYGTEDTPGRLLSQTDLYELLNFGNEIIVTVHPEGFINIKGNRNNVFMTGSDTYQINNVNADIHPDGTYTISDGGNTDVIIV